MGKTWEMLLGGAGKGGLIPVSACYESILTDGSEKTEFPGQGPESNKCTPQPGQAGRHSRRPIALTRPRTQPKDRPRPNARVRRGYPAAAAGAGEPFGLRQCSIPR
jgi:hypothetical protein